MKGFLPAALAALALAGCASYRWTSQVPPELRTVAVPTFRNESDVTELGALAAGQLLREFQREGTFRVARPGDAAVEVQGIVRKASSGFAGGSRKTGMRVSEWRFTMEADVSVVDRRSGRVMIDGRRYTAETTYLGGQDRLTDQRNASGRLAEDLARQVVDDVTSIQW